MANQSIYAAFERMWYQIISALSGKSDVGHTHEINEIIPNDTVGYLTVNEENAIIGKTLPTIGEEIANLYIWKEYNKEPTDSTNPWELVDETDTLTIAYKHLTIPAYTYNKVLYSTSFIINNGVVELVNPEERVFEDMGLNYISQTDVLKGKYIQIIKTQSISDVYYIPENATIQLGSQQGSYYRYYILGDAKCKKVVPSDIFLGYRTSVSPNEFPSGGVDSTTGNYYIGGNRIGDVLSGSGGGYTLTNSDKQEIAQSAASIVDTNLLTLIGNEVS